MKRRIPFNEIRDMGYICEGMKLEEYPIHKIAEAEHGSLWYEKNDHNYSCNNPPIKDDKELIEILSAASNSPWDEKRLYRLRSSNWEIRTHGTNEERSKCRELQREVVKFQGLKPLPEPYIEPIKRRNLKPKIKPEVIEKICNYSVEQPKADNPTYVPWRWEIEMNGRFVDENGNELKY